MQEKYGFVYIWYDRKHKRYYIGSHWGTETDGYICSSRWMRKSYKRRPQDFKRKILKRVDDRKETIIEEYRYLSLIDETELGKKYYNLTNHLNGHWTTDNKKILTVGEKISASPNRNANISKANKGRKLTEETKQKLREANKKQFENNEQREMRRIKSLELWSDPEYRKINTENKKGKKQTPEQIQKRILSCKERWKTIPKKIVPKSEKEKQRISLMSKGTIWINNGEKNKRINKNDNMPEGFVKGKIKING
jgi:hypothetical protein